MQQRIIGLLFKIQHIIQRVPFSIWEIHWNDTPNEMSLKMNSTLLRKDVDIVPNMSGCLILSKIAFVAIACEQLAMYFCLTRCYAAISAPT